MEYGFRVGVVACVAAVIAHEVRLAVAEARLSQLPPAGIVEDIKEIKVDVRELRKHQEQHLLNHGR
jgi:hypothetical protein